MKRTCGLFGFFILMLLFGGSVAFGGEMLSDAEKKDWPAELTVLTGATGGQWDVLGTSIADVLSRSLVSSTSCLGGGISNVKKIQKGCGDIGFTMSCFLHDAKLKKEAYGDLSVDNAVLLTHLYPQILYILIRKDFARKHGIQNLEDLLQKDIPVRFATLKKGTGSYFLFDLLLRSGFHYTFDQLREKGWEVNFNNYSEIADRFANKELDCLAYTAGSNVPLIVSMEKYVDITVLPIPKKILEMLRDTYSTTIYTIHQGTYKGVTSPVYTLSDYACLVVQKDLPENLVYHINKSIWENRRYLGAGVRDFFALSPSLAIREGIATHPGSLRFWSELQSKIAWEQEAR